MSQLLALEWNSNEARVAVAAVRGNHAVIEQACSFPLWLVAAEAPDAADIGQQIAAGLAERRIGRSETLVAVGRASIELRQLTVPPVPADELPEVVRFQALREFNELQDDWALDFVPIDESADGPRTVLAAAIDPQALRQIQQTCQAAGLQPRRLILRPCAAASLFARSQPAENGGPTLLVDLLEDEADLTVVSQRRVMFMRTARLPGEPFAGPEYAAALVAEIRRTMAAAQNQLGGRRVETVVFCGQGPAHAALAKSLEAPLGVPVGLFEPFAAVPLGRQLERQLPDHPGRFAPLLGMLMAEYDQAGHAIDFLHPRRRPPPPSRRKLFVAASVAVGLLVLGYFAYGWIARYVVASQIRRLDADLQSWGEAAERVDELEKKIKEVEKWTAGEVDWLDELARLSKQYPPAQQAMVIKVIATSKPQGGEMKVEGLADSHPTVSKIHSALGDASHRVVPKGTKPDDSKKFYTQSFKGEVFVVPQQKPAELPKKPVGSKKKR